jgi:hypothetical protein
MTGVSTFGILHRLQTVLEPLDLLKIRGYKTGNFHLKVVAMEVFGSAACGHLLTPA